MKTLQTLRRNGAILALATAAALGGCASDRVVAPAEMRGGTLTDWYSHRTLYTYDKDSTNPPSSACTGQCAVNWPPFTPREGDRGARDFTIIKRADGTEQWAYQGKPLYFYVGDKKTGDKNGEGLGGGAWHAVTVK